MGRDEGSLWLRGGVSVVIPCLDEERTIVECVRESLAAVGGAGEVVVADNGSRDRSREVAAAAGARVVAVAARGYGAALDAGIRAAHGDAVVFADADGSYPFHQVPDLVGPILAGESDVVLGSRLGGAIEPGAMPWLNRHLGTPVLSWLIRRLFGLPVSDCNSGMRALSAAAYPRLGLRCPGMEYASEMLIRTAQTGLRYREVPIRFRRDRRDRPPHLARWSDGWRHLRFILGHAPAGLLIAPLAAFSLAAALAAFVLSFLPTHGGQLRFHTAFSLLACAAPPAVLCYALLIVKAAGARGAGRESRLVALLDRLAARSTLVLAAVLFYALTALELVVLLLRWREAGYQDLFAMDDVIRMSVLSGLGTACLALDVGLALVRLYVVPPEPPPAGGGAPG